jgi:hypothetical protein
MSISSSIFIRKIAGIALFIQCLSGYSQATVSAEPAIDSVPSLNLIGQIESEFKVTIYYRPEWLVDVKATQPVNLTSLQNTLAEWLNGTSLRWYADADRVYIFPGKFIVPDLPEYNMDKELSSADNFHSETELDAYLQTKTISETKFITIGTDQNRRVKSQSNIYGSIINKVSGEPMIGATVYINELKKGTITDVNGEFLLKLMPGEYTLRVSHMAMKEMTLGVKVLSSGPLNLELENELVELEEVTVSDRRQTNTGSMLMGLERISSKSIKEIPLVLGEKDVLKVAQMLPGVQSVGEGASGFNVRGGSADQNMIYINNIPVYRTSHLFGFFTAFNPDIVSDFTLYKNNIPASYGGRIASVFEINTRIPNKERFFMSGGISPITGHLMMEAPVVKEKVAVAASVRSTYSDWILKQINDKDLQQSDAAFYDGSLGLTAGINGKNNIEAFLYRSSDRFSLSEWNDYQYSNQGGSVRYTHDFSDALSSELLFSHSNYQFSSNDKTNVSEAYSQEYALNHSEGRLDFLWTKPRNHRIEFGLNSVMYTLDRGTITPFGQESMRIPVDFGQEFGLESALYFSDEFKLTPRLNALAGIRYSLYSYFGPAEVNRYSPDQPKLLHNLIGSDTYGRGEIVRSYSGFEPRISLNYALSTHSSVKVAYNRLKQYIFLLSNTIAIAPNDQWKLVDYHLVPPEADQASAGFYYDFKEAGISTYIEGYKKWIHHVVQYRDGADFISVDPIETLVLQGKQNSWGVEVMVKKSKNNLTGWMSYAYSRSLVTVDHPFPENRINDGNVFPSNYDRPHSVNMVANYRISRRISFSSNLVYMTGRPITLPIATYYSEGQQFLLYSPRNEYRIPDYFRIDFSINLEGNLKYKKLAHSFWMLSIYNLTGRNNAYSVFYELQNDDIQGYKLSIFAQPIVTLSWNFKFGNYNSE